MPLCSDLKRFLLIHLKRSSKLDTKKVMAADERTFRQRIISFGFDQVKTFRFAIEDYYTERHFQNYSLLFTFAISVINVELNKK